MSELASRDSPAQGGLFLRGHRVEPDLFLRGRKGVRPLRHVCVPARRAERNDRRKDGRKEATRRDIAQLAGDQHYVVTAGAFLVFCADLHRAAIACEKQGGQFVRGMTEHFIIATVDVALFAQNCAIAAESMGLGICYIGGIRNDPQRMCDLLNLPDQVYPVFGFCLGYPRQDPEIKPRLPLSVVLKQEPYDGEKDTSGIEAYDEKLAAYYRTRTGGSKESCWTLEMKNLVGKESRPHMREFLKSQGFEMK